MPTLSSAYLVAVPLVTITIAGYGAVMPFGVWGYFGGAVAGALWAFTAGFIAAQLVNAGIGTVAGDVTLFCCIVVMGIATGGALMYMFVFRSVLREPSATYAVLSAMMRPTVPFFIALNSAMELVFVPLIIFLSWPDADWRRWLTIAAAAVYVVHRVWTYAVFAKPRLDTASKPLTPEDVDWYTRTFASDYRIILNIIVLALFTAAAFLPRH
jgi:hypothetical protein